MQKNATNSSRRKARWAVAALLVAIVLFWSRIEGLAHAHADGEHDDHSGRCVVCQAAQAPLDDPLTSADLRAFDTPESRLFAIPERRPVVAEAADDRRARGPPDFS